MKYLLVLFSISCAAPSAYEEAGLLQIKWTDRRAAVSAHPELIRLREVLRAAQKRSK